MNEKEYDVERARLEVKEAESKLRVAKKELECGRRQLQRGVDRALSDYKKANDDLLLRTDGLIEEVTRAEISLEACRANCKRYETLLENGFDDTN